MDSNLKMLYDWIVPEEEKKPGKTEEEEKKPEETEEEEKKLEQKKDDVMMGKIMAHFDRMSAKITALEKENELLNEICEDRNKSFNYLWSLLEGEKAGRLKIEVIKVPVGDSEKTKVIKAPTKVGGDK